MGTWIEIVSEQERLMLEGCRALMGTWIEICGATKCLSTALVVPSWARGLKFDGDPTA